jgi:DNA-binding NarL/FixJ family response regulator
MAAKIRVLVVDDYTLVRQGIRECLESSNDIVVVAEAVNGEQALDLFETYEPDLTVMDVQMPVMGGIEATRAILSIAPKSRIMVLTAFEERAQFKALLDLGVGALLLKTCEIGELQEAVRAVVRGERFIQSGLVLANS